ncbi:MAG: hypothetical protein E7366_04610 [Clostridiales bacterium]|nr:hypothetical protein [Clostridiales bacterium]
MKKASPLIFYSDLSPQDFIERTHDTVLNEHYSYFFRTEKGFLFQIDCNHGGKEYFECTVLANENSGSIINGKIIHEPWNPHQSTADKVRDGIVTTLIYILLFPLFIFIGIENLILHISKKQRLSPYEKKAIRFMTDKMGCIYKKADE